MVIETKYNIGERVWVVDEVTNSKGVPYEIQVYSEVIKYVTYEDELFYHVGEAYEEIKEDEIIPYTDLEKLVNRIKEIDEKIMLGGEKQ